MSVVKYEEIIMAHREFIYTNKIDDNHFVNINNTFEETINTIRNNKENYLIFLNNIITYNITLLYYRGLYYYSIMNYTEMMYLLYNLENSYCLILIGNYYQYIKKEYDLMDIYYKKAINLGSSLAKYMLANFYFDIDDEYQAKKNLHISTKYHLAYNCYKIIKYDIVHVLYLLALRRIEIGKYKAAKTYLKKAIKRNHIESMFILGELYNYLNKQIKACKYYKMAAEKGHIKAIHSLQKQFHFNPSNNEVLKQKSNDKSNNENTLEKYYIWWVETPSSKLMKKTLFNSNKKIKYVYIY